VIVCGCTERHGNLFRDALKSFSASNYQLFIPTLLIRGQLIYRSNVYVWFI